MPRPVLTIIDAQERLFSAMDAERRESMIGNLKILATAARRLGHPVVLTEQYPRGLGRTLPELRALLPDVTPLEKTAFSCARAPGFEDLVRSLGADPVVLAGVEAHVCVLLTALDLVAAGLPAVIVADAVCSRRRESVELALAQARQAGIVVTSTETLVFQWLGQADTDVFREVAKLLR